MKVQDIVRLMKWGGWAVQLAATKFLGFWAVCIPVAVWCRLVMVVLWLTYHWDWSSILYKAGNSRTAAAIPGICWLVGAHFVGPICDWARRTLWAETHSPPLDIPKKSCLPLSRNLPFYFMFLLHSFPLHVRTGTHPPDGRGGLGREESITQVFVIAGPAPVGFCCNFVTFSGISLGMNLTNVAPSTYMSSFRF